MRSRVAIVASAIALVDVAILIVFALVANGEGDHLISIRIWNLMLAIAITSIVVAVNAWSSPPSDGEQHYTQGVNDTINSGVVQMRHGNP